MPPSTHSASLRLGIAAGYSLAVLCTAYAVVLGIGLFTLPSADQPIRGPWFTSMEILILAIVPAMLAFMVALHAWVPEDRKAAALLGIAFMGLCAVVTCSVHFAILTLSRQPAITGAAWAIPVLSFEWPSLAYAMDILAWDFFFPLAVLCAASAIAGAGPARAARWLLRASALLAFVGLVGVPLADMRVRNIGIVGYLVLFPIAAVLMANVFRRSAGR